MSDPDQDVLRNRPSRIEIVLSAAVFPGIGQCVQKRWLAAALYLGIGAALAVVLMALVGLSLYAYLALIPEITNISPKDDMPTVSPMMILAALGAFIVVYGLNVVDVSMAYRRRVFAWQRAQGAQP